MATLYWVGGTGTWGTTTNRFSTSSGGAGSVTTPTAADEVRFDANSGSGTVTLPSAAVCRSLDCNGYTGTLSIPSAANLTIGDATAATANRALRFAAGMTLTIGSATTAINLASSSATQQSVDLGGKTVGALNFGTNGGSYVLAAAAQGTGRCNMSGTFATANFNLTFTTGFQVQTVGNNGVFSFGSSTFTGSSWSELSGGTLTVNANTAVVDATSGAGVTGANTFVLNGRDWNGLSLLVSPLGAQFGGTASAAASIVKDITLNGGATRTVGLLFQTGVTCTGTLTVNGNSTANRVLIAPTPGTGASTIYAAAVSMSNVDFMDIVGAGAASWNLSAITGGSGDCGGNSGITFTAGTTHTATGTSGFNWTAIPGASRIPLPQDDVVIPNAFTGVQVITIDMPRIGRNVTFAATWATTAPVISPASYTGLSSALNHLRFFGSLSTNIASNSNNRTWTASGRGAFTITTNGTATLALNIDCATGTYTLTDDYTVHTSQSFLVATGTVNTRNMTFQAVVQTGGTWNAGAFTTTLTGASGNIATFTGGTFNGPLSTFVLPTGSGTRVFSMANVPWTFGTLDYSVAGSTGQLTLGNASSTWTAIKIGPGRTLALSATTAVVTTATSWQVNGTAGNLVSLVSTTSGSRATIANTFGPRITLDYVSLKDIRFAEPHKWYATNATDAGNNVNAHFSAAPGSGPYLRQYAQIFSSPPANAAAATFSTTPLAGQLLLAKLATAGGTPGTVTGPAGWSLVTSASSPFFYFWAKVSDGTETGASATWSGTSRPYHLVLEEVAGFVHTPTLDVLDAATSAGASVLTLATGTGVTNTAQPAWADVLVGLNGTAGPVSATVPTNGYEELYLVSDSNAYLKSAGQPLSALGSQSTTLTWGTARSANAALAVFADIASGPAPTDTGAFLAFMS